MGPLCMFEKSETNHSGKWHVAGSSKFPLFLQLPHIFEVEFMLTKLPPYFSGFSCLVTCSLAYIYTNDDIIEQLVEKCHLLENLRVQRCPGLNSLKISALNLKHLDLNGLDFPQIIMNCP